MKRHEYSIKTVCIKRKKKNSETYTPNQEAGNIVIIYKLALNIVQNQNQPAVTKASSKARHLLSSKQ